MLVVQNDELLDKIRYRYSLSDIREISQFLCDKGTLYFPSLRNGLYSAAHTEDESYAHTGYRHVWVRDNVYVANAHYENGQAETATRSVRTLAEFFENIIDGTLDAAAPMNRPHVRFDGNSLGEVEENWPHAQNDALGYFLWLYCKLRNAGVLASTKMENGLLALFPLYFDAIRFWEDEDNGHWEETRKIEASSIGVVLGGLRELRRVIENDASVEYRYREKIVTADLVDRLMARAPKASRAYCRPNVSRTIR